MRPVVIEIDRKGNPTIISQPRKVEVIFRKPKKRSFKKLLKTMLYHVKSYLGIQ